MSIFSGKCDIYDHYCMIGCNENTTEEDINKRISGSKIYIRTKDGKKHKLDIKNIHDLAPYFPYLTSIAAFNKDGGDVVELSSKSFVDSEEDELLETHLEDIKRFWRKCKRNKKPFDKDDCLKNIWGDRDYIKKMIEVVSEYGDKTTLKHIYEHNIHIPSFEYHRIELYETMVSLGWSEDESYCWCFNCWFPGNKERLIKR